MLSLRMSSCGYDLLMAFDEPNKSDLTPAADPSGAARAGGETGSGATDPTDSSPEKDPSDWVTGDEPATGPQLSYLGTLAQQAGEGVPDDLT